MYIWTKSHTPTSSTPNWSIFLLLDGNVISDMGKATDRAKKYWAKKLGLSAEEAAFLIETQIADNYRGYMNGIELTSSSLEHRYGLLNDSFNLLSDMAQTEIMKHNPPGLRSYGCSQLPR
jgi:hypothetical protein